MNEQMENHIRVAERLAGLEANLSNLQNMVMADRTERKWATRILVATVLSLLITSFYDFLASGGLNNVN